MHENVLGKRELIPNTFSAEHKKASHDSSRHLYSDEDMTISIGIAIIAVSHF